MRLKQPAGDLPPRQRLLLRRGLALAAALLVVVPAAVFVAGRRSRARLEGRVELLQKQLTQDRRSRLALEKAVAAETRRIAELESRRDGAVKERVEGLVAEGARVREELDEARVRTAEGLREIAALEDRLRKDQAVFRAKVESEKTEAQAVIRRSQGGVGLIEGAYGFVDADGRPLRLVEASGDTRVFSVEATGPEMRKEYLGTGFLAARSGLVVTNRHVVEPWWREAGVAEMAARGFRPRLVLLRIFFPGIPEPFDLTVRRVSTTADVALAQARLGRAAPNVLEIAQGKAVAGQAVVLLGYPAGLDTVVARVDSTLLDSIVATSGGSEESLALVLSRHGAIRPLATQGHLGDVLPHQLVYDAQTTVGGSGGPLLDTAGKVIGVNAAILSEFSGASFGVPASYVNELLKAEDAAAAPKVRKKRPGS